MMFTRFSQKQLMMLLIVVMAAMPAFGQTAVFTYQGKLSESGNPANGNYDLQFKLYDALTGGTQIGGRTRTGVPVTDGIFTVQLDFAAGAFTGLDRFLEIGVRPAGSPNPFTTLSPRQPITSTPYAFHSFSSDVADTATTATNANQLGGVVAIQYVLTNDARMTDSRPPASGSPSYIQNSTSQQATSNFNISGNGTLGGTFSAIGAVNTFAQYDIGDVRVLSIPGTNNTFVGSSAGLFNSGANNAFFGRNSGFINMSGSNNSFFGSTTGFKNQTGQDNAFFGTSAGENSTASNNAFFGSSAGKANTTGQGNTLVGYAAGFNITIGSNNTLIGNGADTSTANLTNATAIGANAQVSASNTMVLGTNAVTVQVPGNLNISGSLSVNLPSGDGSYIQNRSSQQSGNANFNINGNGTVGGALVADSVRANNFINAGTQYNINGNAVVSRNALGHTVVSSVSNFVNVSGTLVADGLFVADSDADITGDLEVHGQVNLFGQISFRPNLLETNGSNPLCWNPISSLIVLCDIPRSTKTTDIQNFYGGLNIVKRLRPNSFVREENQSSRDVGFAAQEVGQIEPLLASYNKDGQVEGVKYDRINVVLVHAIKEQQQQINAQQKQIGDLQVDLKRQQQLNQQLKQHQNEIDGLKKLVCAVNPTAELCHR